MIPINDINNLKASDLVCVYSDDEMFNGYILEIADSEPGKLVLIMSHDSEFYDEDFIEVTYEEDTNTIISPEIYLLD